MIDNESKNEIDETIINMNNRTYLNTIKVGEKINKEEEDEQEDEQEDEIIDEKDYGLIFSLSKDNKEKYEQFKFRIKQELFDNIEVNEFDGINRCINELKLLKNHIIYTDEFDGYIANKLFDFQKKLPIENLYKKSIYLAQYFMHRIIRLMNKKNDNFIFKKKCATILLDCSVYIQPNKKIINMLILCAMTIIFINLNIKYSIGLFGDGDFKLIMKQFEEEIPY